MHRVFPKHLLTFDGLLCRWLSSVALLDGDVSPVVLWLLLVRRAVDDAILISSDEDEEEIVVALVVVDVSDDVVI
jgi:hypothetical protein